MFAIATLVMNGNSYVPGAVALAHSLRLFSKAVLICMVTSDVTDRGALIDAFDQVVDVDKITVDAPRMISEGMERTYRSWISDAPTKWNILSLDRYDKVLFMDADMIAIAPIDTIFLLDVPAAVFDSHFSSKYTTDARYVFSTTLQQDNIYGDLSHGEEVPRSNVQRLLSPDKLNTFYPSGGIVLVEPSKFAMNMFLRDVVSIAKTSPGYGGIDEWTILMFYHQNGYTWHHISVDYNVAAYHTYQILKESAKVLHYITPYKPWTEKESRVSKEYPMHLHVYRLWQQMYSNTYMLDKVGGRNLHRYLLSMLEPILGKNTRAVLERNRALYQQVFTTKEANKVSNYELMEAYGDKFLAGQYSWLMIRTPGIINPDQVTKISSFFQNQYQLDIVAGYLGLASYIVKGNDEEITVKMRSDVVEALIGAIGISWQNMYKRGDIAMRNFIFKVWNTVFTIDPENYILLYEDPKTRFKELTERLQINRGLIKSYTNTSFPQEGGGEIIVTIMYGQYPVGTGRASTRDTYRPTAIKEAKKAAYLDALNRNSLQLLINSQSI